MSTIKDIWQKIWTHIKPFMTVKNIYNFVTSKTFLIIIALILLIIIGRSCAKSRDLQRRENIHQQNIAALTDTIKTEKRKSGMLEVSIASYVASEKDLKQLNRNLYEEVRKEKGNVISLNNAVIRLQQTEIQLRDHINFLESKMDKPIRINDSTFVIPWGLKYDWGGNNYDFFGGNTYIGISLRPNYTWWDVVIPTKSLDDIVGDGLIHYKTELTSRESQIDLLFGQKEEDGQLRVFVKTSYPGFTAKSLEGVLIDPNTNPYIKSLMKKKKWLPNTWSVGVGPNFGYNILSNNVYLGIGVSINYNILQW